MDSGNRVNPLDADTTPSNPESWVCVTDPTMCGTPVNRYTAYLVKGVREAPFNSWKRYSEFEFLRHLLAHELPGVCIPALPKKQAIGRFEESFIEERRVRLQEFLRACFALPPVEQSPVLQAFLASSETTRMRRDFGERSMRVLHANYERVCGSYEGDAQILGQKQYITRYVEQIREATQLVDAMITAQENQHAADCKILRRLRELKENEYMFYEKTANPATSEAVSLLLGGKDLTDPLEQVTQLSEENAAPFLALRAVLVEELGSADRIHDALTSLERLQTAAVTLKKNKEAEEAAIHRVEHSERGNLLQNIVQRKTKEDQLREMRNNLDMLHEEVAASISFERLARAYFINCEFAQFITTSRERLEKMQNVFPQEFRAAAKIVADIWGAFEA